jgi:hypothetical protein
MKEYSVKLAPARDPEWEQFVVAPDRLAAADGSRLSGWEKVERLDFVGKSPAGKPPAFGRVEWVVP